MEPHKNDNLFVNCYFLCLKLYSKLPQKTKGLNWLCGWFDCQLVKKSIVEALRPAIAAITFGTTGLLIVSLNFLCCCMCDVAERDFLLLGTLDQ